MKRVLFLAMLLCLPVLMVACGGNTPAQAPADQPATAPETAVGLVVEGQWARAAQLPTDTMAAGAAMTDTAPMAGTEAMTGAEAMTGTTMPTATALMTTAMDSTAAMSATAAMTGSMGMGMGGANSAVYMTIRNATDQADRLIKAESDAAAVVELHNVAEKDGVMAMFPVEAIDVPAGGAATLEPGSFHVMLIGLTRDLNVGDTVTVTLTFEQADPMTITAEVRER